MRLTIALLDSGVYEPAQAGNGMIRRTAERIGVHPPSDITCRMVRTLIGLRALNPVRPGPLRPRAGGRGLAPARGPAPVTACGRCTPPRPPPPPRPGPRPVDAVTTAATAPSRNGASTRRAPRRAVRRRRAAPSRSAPRCPGRRAPRPPRRRSTGRAAAAISSELVPSPPSGVPPAGGDQRAPRRRRSARRPARRRRSATAALCETSTIPTSGPSAGAASRARSCGGRSRAVSASAAISSAAEVAPGSWWPMLRSPR